MDFFRRRAEEKLQEAASRGEFDHLPNAGQRIEYQEYLTVPLAFRLLFKILKNARIVPPEVERMNEIAALRSQLRRTDISEDKRMKLEKVLELRLIERDLHGQRSQV